MGSAVVSAALGELWNSGFVVSPVQSSHVDVNPGGNIKSICSLLGWAGVKCSTLQQWHLGSFTGKLLWLHRLEGTQLHPR